MYAVDCQNQGRGCGLLPLIGLEWTDFPKSPGKALDLLKRKSVETLHPSENPGQSTAQPGSADEVIRRHPSQILEDEEAVSQEGAIFQVGSLQAPKGKYDDVIRRVSDTFREYEEGWENPAGASSGSGEPQSSKSRGKGKEIQLFDADEIQGM